jgi:hypothetical protein
MMAGTTAVNDLYGEEDCNADTEWKEELGGLHWI